MKESEWKISPDGWFPYCPDCYHEPENGVMTNFCPNCGKDMRKVATDAIRARYKHVLKAYGEESEFVQGFRHCMCVAERNEAKWIYDRLPTKEETENGMVAIVNGHDNDVYFEDAVITVDYDFEERTWFSWDYDLRKCRVECWLPIPPFEKARGRNE